MQGKLKCHPGYIQRGAVCQPVKNGSPAQPTPKSGRRKRGGLATAVVGAAVVGAGAAAMAARGKQVPPQVQQAKERAQAIAQNAKGKVQAKFKLGKPTVLPKQVQEAVSQAIDKKSATYQKQRVPPGVKKIAKQVAIDVASRIPGGLAGDIAGGVTAAGTGDPVAAVLVGFGVRQVVQGQVRESLEKRYGAGLESKKGKFAVFMALNLAEAGVNMAVAKSLETSEQREQRKAQAEQAAYQWRSTQERAKYQREKQQEASGRAPKGKAPHETLGVAKTATPAEVKKAYRNLAKKYHPDINPSPEAKTKMAEINRAYEEYEKQNPKR